MRDFGDHVLKHGAHCGRRVADLPTDHLLWCLSAVGYRRAHPDTAWAMVHELQRRLAAGNAFRDTWIELKLQADNPAYPPRRVSRKSAEELAASRARGAIKARATRAAKKARTQAIKRAELLAAEMYRRGLDLV